MTENIFPGGEKMFAQERTVAASHLTPRAWRSALLVTLGLAPACGDGQGGPVDPPPAPETLEILAGDGQRGPAGFPVEIDPALRVLDQTGSPMAGLSVGFSVVEGGGSATASDVTDSSGRASTRWVLGTPGPQRLVASVEGLTAEFSATADPSDVLISTASLQNGHETVLYHARLDAVGGEPPHTWDVIDGSLPAGIELSADGRLLGTPSTAGVFTFLVRARSADGLEGARNLEMRVCAAPPDLAVGEAISAPSAFGECGVFLRAGGGRRYGVAVLRADVDGEPDSEDVVTATLRVFSTAAAAAGRQIALLPEPPEATVAPGPSSSVRDAQDAAHLAVRRSEARLFSSLGSALRPLTSTNASSPVSAPGRIRYDPPRDLAACTDHEDRTATLVAETEDVAVYQDSAQAASAPVDPSSVGVILDFYAAYGEPTIVDYTGGLPDIDGDGRLVVIVTTETSGGAALVWSGDLLDAATCPGSNEREVVYLNPSLANRIGTAGDHAALGIVVHEAKHVASFYHRLRDFARNGTADPFHPPWIEEGTAELVGEVASRRAWAEAGGPAMDARIDGPALTAAAGQPEVAHLVRTLDRVSRYLSRQPNAVTVAPTGSDRVFGVYGSGWHFHRFIGDAFYGPATEAQFFRAQTDSLTPKGIPGIEQVLGEAFLSLLARYAAAIVFEASGEEGPPGFSSYAFGSAIAAAGAGDGYPWPVTGSLPVPLESGLFSGPIGESGLRFHDFVTVGGTEGAELQLDLTETGRVVVVRVP